MTQNTTAQPERDRWAPYQAQRTTVDEKWNEYRRLSQLTKRARNREEAAFQAWRAATRRQEDLFDDAWEVGHGTRLMREIRNQVAGAAGT